MTVVNKPIIANAHFSNKQKHKILQRKQGRTPLKRIKLLTTDS